MFDFSMFAHFEDIVLEVRMKRASAGSRAACRAVQALIKPGRQETTEMCLLAHGIGCRLGCGGDNGG